MSKPASTSTRKRRHRRLSFDRELALERALQLFWQRGYEGASVADLVTAMGITPPSLYTAFGSKEGLYREALGRYGATHGAFLSAALDEEPTALRAMRRLLTEAAHFYADPEVPAGCMVATAAQYCGPEHAGVVSMVAEKRAAIVDAIENRIRRGIREGELPPLDATVLARYYAAVLQGMAVQARDGLDFATLQRVAELAIGHWPG